MNQGRTHFGWALLGAVAIVSVPSPGRAAAPPVVVAQSTFTTGLDGWTSNTVPAQIVWERTGGNPGGFVRFTDTTSGTTFVVAPASFRSPKVDWTALDGDGYIAFDHRIISETKIEGCDGYTILLSGPKGSAAFQVVNPTTQATCVVGPWTRVVAPLVAGDWLVLSGTWAGLLSDVTSIQIEMEQVSNGKNGVDVEGIDNVNVVSLGGYGFP